MMKINNQLLLITFLFTGLAFSSCNTKKTSADEKVENPFGIASEEETQILEPCHWQFTVEQGAGDEAILVSTAKLDSGWILYSQHIPGKGPATEFTYDPLDTYTLIGDTEEGVAQKKYDPNLEMEVLYFEKEAAFRQKIKAPGKKDFTITGTVDYMVCFDHGQCVHAEEEFSFTLTETLQEIPGSE